MTISDNSVQTTETVTPSSDVSDSPPFVTKNLGFCPEQIFIADDLAVVIIGAFKTNLYDRI
jgi:hypothetical protein